MKTESPAEEDDVDAAPLAALVERLVQRSRADAVILFCSRGRGDHRPYSDYDICVLVPPDAPASTRQDLWDAVGPFPGSVDLVILESMNFRRHSVVSSSLEHAIDADGRILYELGS